MKNRNQLVSALLTGVLIGGAAGAASGAAGERVLADSLIENSAGEAGEDAGEAAADPAPAPSQPENSGGGETSGGGSGDTGSGDGGSDAGSGGSDTGTGGSDAGSGGSDTDTGSGDSTDTGAGESENSGTGDSGSGAESGGESAPDSASDASSASEDPSSTAEDPSSGTDSTDSASDSTAGSIASDAEVTEEESTVEETTQYPGGYIYTGGGYAYLTANYHYTGMSSDQWKLYIKYGFRQVDKVYAIANVPEKLNIRDDKSLDAEIVGELPPMALCYILADGSDEWVYVESGGVRGFVNREFLITGKKAEQIVRKYGETSLPQAVQLVEPADNKAFRYSMNTVYDISEENESSEEGAYIDREELAAYARSLVGTPYAWDGHSLSEGTDSANLISEVFAHFGVELPGSSYALSAAGKRIVAEEALCGDLIYYEKDGIVYHVLLYLGDGKGLDATSDSGQVEVVDVDWQRVCWAGRIIAEERETKEETVEEVTEGNLERAPLAAAASEGDEAAAAKIISMLAAASEEEWKEYGFCRSVIIAQAIVESNWCSFSTAAEQGIRAEDNNVLGMNASLANDLWESPWTGSTAERMIPSENEGMIVWTKETMRTYPSIAACLKDYAAFKTGLHPELAGETDYRVVLEKGFPGYASDSSYIMALVNLIETYDLTRFDEASPTEAVSFEQEKEADMSGAVSEGTGIRFEEEDDAAAGPESLAEAVAAEEPESPAEAVAAEEPESLAEAVADGAGDTLEAAGDAASDESGDVSVPVADGAGIELGTDGQAPVSGSQEEVPGPKDTEDEKTPLTENEDGTFTGRADGTAYTQQEMEFIWAVVAEEDDTSYDGAMAVISCVMNRADENYGGYGKNALDQLEAEGQFCCSASVADPIYYQRRLGGNVPDYVKQAVYDCLTQGIRSHTYDGIGSEGEKQIGSKWYS